jgi:DNA-binding CsgD family transcriptional regulator
VRAVLEAAGQTAPAAGQPAWPQGLTGREVAVLRLAARGASMKEIGGILGVTPKTVDHHLQHIYAKIGVRTRAGAAVFAMKHRLLEETPGTP